MTALILNMLRMCLSHLASQFNALVSDIDSALYGDVDMVVTARLARCIYSKAQPKQVNLR